MGGIYYLCDGKPLDLPFKEKIHTIPFFKKNLGGACAEEVMEK